MKARWLGPYAIEESLGKGVYRISNVSTGLVLKKGVNQCRLTLCHGSTNDGTKPPSSTPPPSSPPSTPPSSPPSTPPSDDPSHQERKRKLSDNQQGEPPSKMNKVCNTYFFYIVSIFSFHCSCQNILQPNLNLQRNRRGQPNREDQGVNKVYQQPCFICISTFMYYYSHQISGSATFTSDIGIRLQ